MRINLLLRREPFPTILERTLTRYWSSKLQIPCDVQWQNGQKTNNNQRWLINSYLNVIFHPSLEPNGFDPIRREFNRSVTWWKRPLQQMYVELATAPATARYFAHAHLFVSANIPDADATLIVAGNHKLRLLNHRQQLVINVLKEGFGDHFLRRELATRQIAAQCGIPTPQLLEVNVHEGWYTETYLSGTPINRLASPDQANAAVQQAIRTLDTMYEKTAEYLPIEHYLKQLTTALQNTIDSHHLLNTTDKANLHTACTALTDQLNRFIVDSDLRIKTALSHGDFQPANILLNTQGVWLIDWEYSARRQWAYDRIVYAVKARSTTGLAQRLQCFVDEGWDSQLSIGGRVNTQPTNWQQRRLYSTLFLLEDLLLHLEENNQPPLLHLGDGLTQLQQEIHLWLTSNE